ncbi:MAG: type II toxin-antitoxin system HicB family antitoxin [Solirubrobacteraceae bacterium]
MELTVIVNREPEGLWSQVNELPGCFASGRTPAELHEALGEAVGLYLWDFPAQLHGAPPGLGRSTIRVSGPAGP